MTNIMKNLVKWNDSTIQSVFSKFPALLNFLDIFKKLNDSITKKYSVPDYYIADLAKTAPREHLPRRCYKEALGPVEDQKGLYIFWEKEKSNMFYVGKTGKDEKAQKGCDVFYKSSGGSGRIPHHIAGGERVLFREAFREKPSTASEKYYDYINKFYVLCIAINGGQHFDENLTLWEKYLILSLLPSQNKEVRLKVSDFKINNNNQPYLYNFEEWLS